VAGRYARIRRLVAYVVTAALALTLISLAVVETAPANAITGSDFDAGYIISDRNFYDGAAMSEAEIQRFLETTVGSCANANCLAVYRADTPTRTWSFGTCSTYNGAPGESAARIIFKVQQACSLSAKVILVTLQKEQTLLTNPAPTDGVMRKAMGYGCPDTSVCDSTYYGFFNQVFAAGRQLTWYGNPAGSFTSIRIGQANSIRYNPDAACGSKSVVVQNKATAALYYYTPYTPNAAALANLGGMGDYCSAYGNRNFWVFYNQWFGSPTGDLGSPIASLDVVAATPGHVRVAGWAFDPDTSASIQVHIYINGYGTAIVASNDRPDVGATWPSVGSAHGFDVTIPMPTEGPQTVCVWGINLGPGQNKLFGCPVLPGLTGSPTGSIDVATAFGGQLTVRGWTFDPDTAASTPVHIYVDSTGYAFTADDVRDDVAAAYPPYGSKHGFTRTMPIPPGTHTVCVYGINIAGLGANRPIGCRTVTNLSGSPVGVIDSVTAKPGSFDVSGWTFDPDTPASIPVHVYANTRGVAGTANQPRDDVAAAYPGYGNLHGYTVNVPASPGMNSVCAYGIEIQAPGANRALACRNVVGMSGPPVGVFDAVGVSSGSITVGGWVYDPDTTQPIPVHVYVDSNGYAFTAGKDRPDVGAVYPAYGPAHGYNETIAASPGTHNVCVYGINIAAGDNVLLRCTTVNVP
jgi:hypothetical protein